MTEDVKEINAKIDSLIEAVEELQKSQKETTEAMAMLTEELQKMQKIVEQAVK